MNDDPAAVAATRATVERLARIGEPQWAGVIEKLSVIERRSLLDCWPVWTHPGQLVAGHDWRVRLIRAGRGFGKTRAGAEWVSALLRSTPGARIALVGATADDVERVMIEGRSGLIAVMRHGDHFRWRRDAGELRFANDACAFVYSAGAPEKLRGPEHHAAWCDEIAKWRYGEAAWDNLMLGLRLGEAPQVLVTTTPRPVPLMRRVMAMRELHETRGRTHDNPHLPAAFVDEMDAQYGGTRLGRQELDGEMIDDMVGALWSRAMLAAARIDAAPVLVRVVVGVDPPAGSDGDACGIVAAGIDAAGQAYVLEDATVEGAGPEGWARAVATCAARWRADRVVAEKNQGGDMVGSVLRAADAMLPLTLVHASRGKVARAEPVAALYETGKVRHAGAFPDLEAELAGLVIGGGYAGPGRSPDRADALVWALTELMLGRRGAAGMRAL